MPDDETGFAGASRRSTQEAVRAINARSETAASIHWRWAVFYSALAAYALRRPGAVQEDRRERRAGRNGLP